MNVLLGLPYSPWTEKARFALDARRVPYTFRHYQPLVGEPALRLKLRRLRGPVTVPVLTADDGRVLDDSMDIARWGDDRGDGPRLFPTGQEAAVTRLVALSERALAAGRARSLERILADEEALAEVLPAALRSAPGALRIARFGIQRTRSKYGAAQAEGDAHLRALEDALDEIRAALAAAPSPEAGAPRALLGGFSFADIAVAQALVSAEPPSSGMKMGPASRRSFVEPGLKDRYADLVAWRDDLYRAYRNAPARA